MVKRARGRRILRIGAFVLGAVLLLVIAGSLYLYFHTATLKAYLERNLSKRAGLTVTIGRLHYRLLPFRAAADSVRVDFTTSAGRADIRIGRAAASGGLRRLLRKQKPYFDSVILSGLEAEFFQSPTAGPAGAGGIADLARLVSDNLEYAGAWVVQDANIRVHKPGERGWDLTAEGMSLKAGMTGTTDIDLSVAKLLVRSVEPAFILAAGLRAEAKWPRDRPFSLDGSLELVNGSLSFPKRSWEAGGITLKAGFQAGDRSVKLTSFNLALPEIAVLSGSGTARWGGDSVAEAETVLEIPDLERAKKLLAPFLPSDLPAFSLDGSARWEGKLRREAVSGAAKVQVDGSISLPPARFIMNRAGLSIDQTLQAELRLQGGTSGLRISGMIEGRSGGRLAAGTIRAEGVSFRLPVDYDGRRAVSGSIQARVRELNLPAGSREIKLSDVSIAGRLAFNSLKPGLEIGPLTVDVPGLGGFGLRGESGIKAPPRFDLFLESKDLDLGRVLGAFQAFVPTTVAAWKSEGTLGFSVEIRNGTAIPAGYLVRGTADLSRLAFQDPSGDIVSENLEPGIEFEAEVGPVGRAIPFSIKFGLPQGESLWKAVYFNWKTSPVRVELQGNLDRRSKRVDVASASIFFSPLGEVKAQGRFDFSSRLRSAFRLAAPSIDLAALSVFLGKTISGGLPPWEIQGRAEVEVDLRFDSSYEVRGIVRAREATASRKDRGFTLAGVDLDLPFTFSHGLPPGGRSPIDLLAPGHLAIRSLETPLADFSPLRIDFYSTRNLFLFFPIEVVLWGARLQLGQSVLAIHPVARSVRGVSNLTLTDLDFSRLPFASNNFRLAGRASIPTCTLEIRPGALRLTGPLLGELYGGRLTLDDIRVTEAFSAGRRIAFQAEIAGLDLEKFTASVPFGEVTGIVDVSLRDFALSYGQPESFSLSIVSVPVKGILRKFSFKAVNSLSIISAPGAMPAASSSLFTRLIPSFNYSRIGIACSLKNDVFTLQGTIVENGIQYLVRRSAIFGIDVVNGNPINRIGFKDMIERIKRIGQDQEKK